MHEVVMESIFGLEWQEVIGKKTKDFWNVRNDLCGNYTALFIFDNPFYVSLFSILFSIFTVIQLQN